MSTFDDQFTTCATPAMVSSLADTSAVVFALANGSSSTVDAVVGHEVSERKQSPEGEEDVFERSVIIEEGDKPSWLYIGALATVNGVSGYSVESIGSAMGGLIEVGLMRIPVKNLGSRGRYAS